nr:hypothetical protein [uncultured Draconibacterium sp.]
MIEWFSKLDLKIQVVIISSLTSVVVFLLGWLFKIIYERKSLNFKLKKEFEFEQKKKLKEDIAKNKVHLLNAVEELNHRLWNFSQNVGEGWHNIKRTDWFKEDQYYLNSFVYRFLTFLHWTLKTEKDTISVDTTIADSTDILFLKYIKTFKDIFTAADILKELNYDRTFNTNHFYKNDLVGYTKWIIFNGKVIDFDEFESKLQYNYEPLKPVIEYFSSIVNDDENKNLNVLRCFHLLCIKFLNEFGHDYQKTNKKKIKCLTDLYKPKIKIKNGFIKFTKKSNLECEMKSILKNLKQ